MLQETELMCWSPWRQPVEYFSDFISTVVQSQEIQAKEWKKEC